VSSTLNCGLHTVLTHLYTYRCHAVAPVQAPFSYDATKGIPKSAAELHQSLVCTKCSAPLWGAANEAALLSSLTQHLTLAVRAAQKQHAIGWLVCDDACCGCRTRGLSVRGAACTALGCRGGKLSLEVIILLLMLL
jgi:DNA Polymerase alpha zinc finger